MDNLNWPPSRPDPQPKFSRRARFKQALALKVMLPVAGLLALPVVIGILVAGAAIAALRPTAPRVP